MLAIIGGGVHLVMFLKKAKEFTKLCTKMNALEFNDSSYVTDAYKSSTKKLKIMSFICMIGSIFNTIYQHYTLTNLIQGADMKYPFLWEIYKFLSFISWQLSFYSVTHISANFIILFFMTLTINLCDNLTAKMEVEQQFNRPKNKALHLQSHIQQAKQICQLIVLLNNVLAPFTLVQCFLGMSLSCGAAFNISGILFSVWSKVRIFFTLSNLLFLILFLLNLNYIFSTGQNLEDKVDEIKDCLQQLGEDPDIDWIESEKRQFDGIINKLGGNGTQLRPYSYFNVNNSSFLATLGVIITYVIVLMQFKSTE